MQAQLITSEPVPVKVIEVVLVAITLIPLVVVVVSFPTQLKVDVDVNGVVNPERTPVPDAKVSKPPKNFGIGPIPVLPQVVVPVVAPQYADGKVAVLGNAFIVTANVAIVVAVFAKADTFYCTYAFVEAGDRYIEYDPLAVQVCADPKFV
jgi:hypothetical protein